MAHDRPEPTTDKQQVKCDLEEFGYAIHEGALTESEVVALRERLVEQAELEREQATGALRDVEFPFKTIDFMLNKGRVFIDLALHPLILEYTRHVLRNQAFQLFSQLGLIVKKGNEQGVVHADAGVLGFSTPVPTGLNCMACLTDFEEANGATVLVPRSHLRPLPTRPRDKGPSNVDPGEFVSATAPAGSLIMWESRTWHSTGASTSDEDRLSISTVYTLTWLQQQDSYPAGMHDDVYETLTQDELKLFGFDSWFHLLNRFGPRSPGDTRTNSNVTFTYVPELRRNADHVAPPRAEG
jgi:ectoine hydroxylase-related dioxygenase (phytanoyl-CoA dioxygenase family)